MICGLVGKRLSVTECPLGWGKCMWQHRKDKKCKYTKKDLTVEQYCSLVGETELPDSEIEDLKNSLLKELKNEYLKH